MIVLADRASTAMTMWSGKHQLSTWQRRALGTNLPRLRSWLRGPVRRWVDPEVCTQYGIAATADEAWEANGGGKFSFKIDRAGARQRCPAIRPGGSVRASAAK